MLDKGGGPPPATSVHGRHTAEHLYSTNTPTESAGSSVAVKPGMLALTWDNRKAWFILKRMQVRVCKGGTMEERGGATEELHA